MSSVRLEKVLKELDAVAAKLEAQPPRARRLALLRRQATLGDIRDAARDAARRRAIEGR